jgi:hypothetical protein
MCGLPDAQSAVIPVWIPCRKPTRCFLSWNKRWRQADFCGVNKGVKSTLLTWSGCHFSMRLSRNFNYLSSALRNDALKSFPFLNHCASNRGGTALFGSGNLHVDFG